MKHYFSAITICLFILVFATCKKDDHDQDPIIPDGPTIVTTVVGKVTYPQSSNPITGAVVKMGNLTTTTDENGFYTFENATVPSDFITITFEYSFLYKQTFSHSTHKESVNYFDAEMTYDYNSQFSFQSSAGYSSSLNLPDPFAISQIIIPADAFVDQNDNPYTGTVQFSDPIWDIELMSSESLVPGGEIKAINMDGNATSFRRLGTIRLEALDNNSGMKLKLAPGKIIEVIYPISQNHWFISGTINAWLLNEESGIWLEKLPFTSGKINIDELGTWSLGTAAPVAIITGRVVDCNNKPMPGVEITVPRQFTALTDNNGVYKIRVPVANNSAWSYIQVDPFNNKFLPPGNYTASFTTNEGNNSTPDLILPCTSKLTGNLKNCQGTDFVSGFTEASWAGNSNYTFSQNGSYELYVPSNNDMIVKCEKGSEFASVNVTSGNAGSVSNVPDLNICAPGSQPNKISFTLAITQDVTGYELTPTITTATRIDTTGDGTFDKMSIHIEGQLYPGNKNCIINMELAVESPANVYSFVVPSFVNNTITIQIDSDFYETCNFNFYNCFTDGKTEISDFGTVGNFMKGEFEFDVNGSVGVSGFRNGKFYALRIN